MNSEDPTRKYPSPEDYQTRNNLEELLTRVVREVVIQEVTPQFAQLNQRLDRLEAAFQALRSDFKELRKDFRHFWAEAQRDLVELEDRIEVLETPKS
ncbi:MAG TPA: hypothetical protein PKE58_12450 [Acidobacteriota bacterium]|nr:hypothetical protein [Acidobacteriota bacterium]